MLTVTPRVAPLLSLSLLFLGCFCLFLLFFVFVLFFVVFLSFFFFFFFFGLFYLLLLMMFIIVLLHNEMFYVSQIKDSGHTRLSKSL